MIRHEGGQAFDASRVAVGPGVDEACPPGYDERPHRRHAPLEVARRAPADQRSHEQAHVEGARVDEQSFEDVGVPAQMRPPHASGLVEMGVGSFGSFGPWPRQDMCGHNLQHDAHTLYLDRKPEAPQRVPERPVDRTRCGRHQQPLTVAFLQGEFAGEILSRVVDPRLA